MRVVLTIVTVFCAFKYTHAGPGPDNIWPEGFRSLKDVPGELLKDDCKSDESSSVGDASDEDHAARQINKRDKHGWTLLHWVAHEGHIMKIDSLLANPYIDVNKGDRMGWSALAWAAHAGQVEIVKKLLAYPHTIPDAGPAMTTPLHLAAANGCTEIVEALLATDLEMNVNRGDKHSRTALHFASSNGHLRVVEQLLVHAAINTNCVDRLGRTALHYAAERNFLTIVEALIGHQESSAVNIVDKFGKTAMHVAANKGHLKVVNAIYPSVDQSAWATYRNPRAIVKSLQHTHKGDIATTLKIRLQNTRLWRPNQSSVHDAHDRVAADVNRS